MRGLHGVLGGAPGGQRPPGRPGRGNIANGAPYPTPRVAELAADRSGRCAGGVKAIVIISTDVSAVDRMSVIL